MLPDGGQATKEVTADQSTAGRREESLPEGQGRKSRGGAVVERFSQQRKVIAGAGLHHLDESDMEAPGRRGRYCRTCGLSDEVVCEPNPARQL